METNQHRALLVHVPYRQPRAVAVAPGRPFDGAKQALGLHLGQVPQVVFEHTLLDGDLRSRVQMLHLAATASTGVQTEMRTARAYTLRTLA